ncbi:MAG: hypothetical protein Q7T55_22090 [Solirubrobacteraceae bacterium]|nr:hypothetical protein [Solirubrobacteraceae bacterium]
MSRGPSSRSLFAACGVALTAAALAPAAALADTPASGYEKFAGCPNREDVQACQTVDFAAGSFGLGNLTIPVTSAVSLAGGASNTDLGSFYVSDAGSVLKPVSLPIDGGLAGLTGDASSGSDAVSASPSLTADPEFTVDGILLKLRFGFEGAGLPEGCAIGSAEDPVTIEITNATTAPPEGVEPLTGDPGSADVDILRSVITSNDVLFVANAYAVPAASGCGDAVDGQINGRAGLPAAAGASQTYAREASVAAAFDLIKVFG